MVINKIVNATQLDDDLTDIANAIRTKSGGSSQLTFPSGFVSEIQAIPSGGGGINGVGGEIKFGNARAVQTTTENVIINFPDNVLFLERLFQSSTKASGVGNVKLTVNCKSLNTDNNNLSNYLCFRSAAVDEVEINCSDADYIILGPCCFQGPNCSVKKVSGTPLSLSKYCATTYLLFQNNTAVEDIIFYENSSEQTVNFGTCSALSEGTLVSLANGLQVSHGSAAITLHATPKTRLASIVGTVESVTRGTETYDRFVVDTGGSVTLQDFITAIKGWTLA